MTESDIIKNKKPFLKRGSGWHARMQATREGRRYRPRGGSVVIYTESGESSQESKHLPNVIIDSKAALGNTRRVTTPACLPCISRKRVSKSSAQSALFRRDKFVEERVKMPTVCNEPVDIAATSPNEPLSSLLPVQTATCTDLPDKKDQDLEEFCKLESEVLQELSNKAHDGNTPTLKEENCACDRIVNRSKGHPREVLKTRNSAGKNSTAGKSCKANQALSLTANVLSQQLTAHEGENWLDRKADDYEDNPHYPTSNLVQKLFYSHHTKAACRLQPEEQPDGSVYRHAEQIQEQMQKLKDERASIARQRQRVEDDKNKLEQDRASFESRKAELLSQFETTKTEELRKLQRDRRVLEKQSRALLKLPTKRDKEDLQALEAVLHKERQNSRGKDARHKLTVERLRRQILELQGKIQELQEQVQYLESQRLQHWEKADTTQCTAEDIKIYFNGRPDMEHDISISSTKCLSSEPLKCNTPENQQARDIHQTNGSSDTDNAQNAEEALHGYEEFKHERTFVTEEVNLNQHCTQLPPVRVSLHKHLPGFQRAELMQGSSKLGNINVQHKMEEVDLQQPISSDAQLNSKEMPDALGNLGLRRFNQLEQSMLQQNDQQKQLIGHLTNASETSITMLTEQPSKSYQPSPTECGAADPHSWPYMGIAPPAVDQADDLRRLGRIMTSAGAGPAAFQSLIGKLVQSTSSDIDIDPILQAANSECDHQQVIPQIETVATVHKDGVDRKGQCHVDGQEEPCMRVFEFPNGSKKQQWPDGHVMTSFSNGDVKKCWPDGKVEYYYNEVDCWHVTHAHKVEVFFFPSGQVEAHHPGGIKEIIFPDGSITKVLPDGRELHMSSLHLSNEIQLPKPGHLFHFVG